jgi:hypothetical protein
MSDSSDGAACSSGWQAEYSAAHRKALGCLARQLERPWYGRDVCDAASSQFVVFSARENIIDNKPAGGFADRIVGLVSTFAMALASTPMRPFLIDWPGVSGGVEGILDVLRTPNLDSLRFNESVLRRAGFRLGTTRSRSWVGACGPVVREERPIFVNATRRANATKGQGVAVEKHRVLAPGPVFDPAPWECIDSFFARQPHRTWLTLRSSQGNTHTLLGRSINASREPLAHKYGSRLRELGLQWPSAFSCLFYYLFSTKHTVLERRYSPLWRAIVRAGSSTVGIQIRSGDARILNPNATEPTIDGAVGRGLDRVAVPTPSPFFLMSDAASFLIAASEDGWKGHHIIVPPSTDITYYRSEKKPPGALLAVLGEVLAFARCRYKVISARSGLGRIAAFLSNPVNTTVQVHVRYGAARQLAVGAYLPPSCNETSGRRRSVADIAQDPMSLASTHSKI